MTPGKNVRIKANKLNPYPQSMHGIMVLGERLDRFRWDVLCEDNQIRVADAIDLELA